MTEVLVFLAALPVITTPLVLTIVTWAVLTLLPTSGMTSVADLTPMFESLGRMFLGVVLTLVYWLVYFAVT